MTDKEMAEEYVHNHVHYEVAKREDGTEYVKEVSSVTIEEAYLAALKAGRPKWRKVADEDFPKHCRYGTRTSANVLVKFKSSNIGVCYFDFDLKEWVARSYPEQLDDVIAWCEIPM